MAEWLKVFIGVVALVAAPTIPALYVEYLWAVSREHDRSEATAKNNSNKHDQGNAVPSATPVQPRTAESNPNARTDADQADDRMKLTGVLLVVVGFLQFLAIAATVVIARRQTDLLRIQQIAT